MSTKRKEIVNGLCASEQALWSQQMAWPSAVAESHVSSSGCSPLRNRSRPHLFLPGHCQIKRGTQTGREENFILYYKIRKQMQCSFPTGQHKAFSTCRQRGLTASEQAALHGRAACRLGAAPADPGPSLPPVAPRDTPPTSTATGAGSDRCPRAAGSLRLTELHQNGAGRLQHLNARC